MQRIRRVCLIALLSVAGLGIAVAAAYAVDSAFAGGEAARNTEVAGRRAGGLNRVQLARLVAKVADEYRSSPVVVDAPQGGFTTNARDLGLSIDPAATVRVAMKTGRGGNVVSRITSWAKSFLQ